VTALPRANRAGVEIVPLTTKSIGKEPASLLLSMQAPEAGFGGEPRFDLARDRVAGQLGQASSPR
jgi:hypothetical protein